MKRKTFAKWRTIALGLLLLEAMLLLVLVLAHTGASAEDSGNFGAPGEAAGFGDSTSHSDGSGASGASDHHGSPHWGGQSPYLCGSPNHSCVTRGGDAADVFEPYGGRGQDFSGSGGGKSGGGSGGGSGGAGGNSAGGNGGSGQDWANWNGPSFGFFPGGGGGNGSAGGNSGTGNSHSGGQDSDQGPDGQKAGQDNGVNGGSGNGDDGDDANSPVIADFVSPDAGTNDAGDPPPGAGDPPASNDADAPTPVPEPMTGSLLAAGLATILVLRRHRR